MSKLAHSNPDHADCGALCHRCGLLVDPADLSVEAFELCGELTCDECSDEVFEENSQFGLGA